MFTATVDAVASVVASVFIFQENTMSHKEQKSNREAKKAPAMTLKERREAKHAKKAAKVTLPIASS
jgi:hypothetical protein